MLLAKENGRLRSVSGIYARLEGMTRTVTALYQKTADGWRVVWEKTSSCFGTGRWSGDEPWNGSDTWNGNYN